MTLKQRALLLFTTIMFPLSVHAQNTSTNTTTNGSYYTDGSGILNQAMQQQTGSTEDSFAQVVKTLTQVLGFVRTAGIVIAIIMLIWCAVQLASSAGNQQKRAQAMDGIKNVLIATAIIGGAALIAQLALGILKG